MVYDEDPTIPPLAVRTAANRLGVSVWAVHKAIDRGELRPVTRSPLQVSAADVEQMRVRRRDEAVDRIGLDRMARLAADVRAQLHPPIGSGAPGGHAALEKLSERVKAAFGMPLLHAAAMPEGSGCRWCAAEVASRILQVPVRQEMLSSAFGVALLGGPECERHRGLVRDRMGQLGARVHPGRGRPGDGRTEPVAAAGSTAPAAPAVARPRPAQPVKDDDGGRAWIAARLRTERERLKVAKRAGDQRRAIQLRATIRGLEADAARVDGRTPEKAGARPGRLRCGHLLSAGCACPRRASRGRR
jgi:hypothetical protein